MAAPESQVTPLLMPPREHLYALATRYGLRLIVLFGSTARGDIHRESDLDIGVWPQKPLSAAQRQHLWEDLSRLFKRDVDLTDLNRITPVLGWQIACEAKPFFMESPETWETWRGYQFRRFWDTWKFRQALETYLNRRSEEMRHALAK